MRISAIVLTLAAALFLLSCRAKEKGQPHGFVVLSPEVAEMICALGAESEICGITEECNYPQSLSSKKIVGNFSAINREAIMALNPAMVFCSSLEQESIALELSKLGLQVEVVYPTGISELLSEITRLGKLIDREKEAKKLISDMNSSLAEIKQSAAGQTHPKVYLEIYRNPLMSVSDKSFVGELLETAGADNIFPTLERDYARVNPETVIKANPDIIICYSQDSLPNILSRKGWQDIPAIRTRTVYFEQDINPDLLQRATPRCIEGMKQLQDIFAQWRKKNG